MNRITIQTCDPVADSSAGLSAVRSSYPGDLLLVTGPRLCPCGCAETPSNPKGTFRMGHDMRLRGMLTRAAAVGALVVLVSPGGVVCETVEPVEFASRFSTGSIRWEHSVAQSASKIRERSTRAATPESELIARALKQESEHVKVRFIHGPELKVQYRTVAA
jgi:hypothetical protein